MKRIFILENEPDVAEIMKLLLESEGYSATYTLKIPDALSRMEKYDILLLDMRLGLHASGRTVLAEMKKRGIKIPVIVVSAVELPRTVAEELSETYPGVDFVAKTNMRTDLVPAIKAKIGI